MPSGEKNFLGEYPRKYTFVLEAVAMTLLVLVVSLAASFLMAFITMNNHQLLED